MAGCRSADEPRSRAAGTVCRCLVGWAVGSTYARRRGHTIARTAMVNAADAAYTSEKLSAADTIPQLARDEERGRTLGFAGINGQTFEL